MHDRRWLPFSRAAFDDPTDGVSVAGEFFCDFFFLMVMQDEDEERFFGGGEGRERGGCDNNGRKGDSLQGKILGLHTCGGVSPLLLKTTRIFTSREGRLLPRRSWPPRANYRRSLSRCQGSQGFGRIRRFLVLT